MAAVPLKCASRIVGILFASYRRPHLFTESERRAIETLANYAAIAIANAEVLVTSTSNVLFQSVFLSYSQEDEEFATALFRSLTEARVRVWFAPANVRGGQQLSDQIDEAISDHERLLIVLSKSSLASNWVKTEILRAHRHERGGVRRKLFPIRLISMDTTTSPRLQ